MNALLLEGCKFYRIPEEYSFGDFDCGDSDLNEFLFSDSKPHTDSLLAVTYILENPEGKIILFASLLNDKVSLDTMSRAKRKAIQNSFPENSIKSRYNCHPALKLGRFAVSKEFQSSGYGGEILNFLKKLFANNNRTGCRFITVDAYNNSRSIRFYTKSEFVFFGEKDKNFDTRQMYFDLLPLKKSI